MLPLYCLDCEPGLVDQGWCLPVVKQDRLKYKHGWYQVASYVILVTFKWYHEPQRNLSSRFDQHLSRRKYAMLNFEVCAAF